MALLGYGAAGDHMRHTASTVFHGSERAILIVMVLVMVE